MNEANYEQIARLEQSNWWYQARREWLERRLRRFAPFPRCLDVGCGVGANLPVLRRLCAVVEGVDPSRQAISWCRERGFTEARLGDAEALPAQDGELDLVTCLDVLEHLDDRRAIAEAARVLRPGGLLAVSVPAHPHLWNDNDDHSHHRRRYRRRQLAELLVHFEVLELSYWNFVSYPPTLAFAAWRRWHPAARPTNNLLRIPRVLNRSLLGMLRIENRLREHLWLPPGTSLFALARRPGAVA